MMLAAKVEKFVTLVITYHGAIYEGDKRKSQKLDEELDMCICDIKQIPEWQTSIKKLLYHDNKFVRIEAACMLLPFDTRHAVWTLRKCCLSSGVAGLNAQCILREWKAGKMKFPEYEEDRIVYK